MDEGSTYSTTREKVINYERTTASWNSSTAYKEMEGFNKGQRQERWKGEAYGKDSTGKGKGKIDGKSKGKQFDTNKGKSFKSLGKQDGEGKETGGLAHDACKLCGAIGVDSVLCVFCVRWQMRMRPLQVHQPMEVELKAAHRGPDCGLGRFGGARR